MGFGAGDNRPTIGDNCNEIPTPTLEAVAERTNERTNQQTNLPVIPIKSLDSCGYLVQRVKRVFSFWAIPNG